MQAHWSADLESMKSDGWRPTGSGIILGTWEHAIIIIINTLRAPQYGRAIRIKPQELHFTICPHIIDELV